MNQKVTLGTWFKPAFRALYAMRTVRGTRWDLFGYTEVRRAERALVVEYRQIVNTLLADLGADALARAVEIAALPDLVRGYEHVKLDSIRAYHLRLHELQQRPEVPVG
jgi:indolepyruvate ferredoxin oxidoreductase